MKTSLLVGLALGDGHISANSNNTRAALVIRHSDHQLDYINWKYALCPDIWNKKPTKYKNILNGKRYYGHYLRSQLDLKLMEIRKILYPNGKKQYTREILDMLDEQAMAIWYMDDGCLDNPIDRSPMGILNTYGHTNDGEEEKIIQLYFLEKWNIKMNLNKNHGRYRLRMPNPEFVKFINIIKPYIIDSMKYKIDLNIRHNAQAIPNK